ncbi:zinc finger BED domain-containing protein DAYSLEEPER [Neltuma alba]|uniref:zinc finger BED domain-containing protein DAYSLEEPER n=1 Tax=Neltuma alba TaxID=207710 RepID=UPI0010A42B3F|nr:zinc finger BED domain-containing protein DAYSLEEPER-like [Prosopis alba]
MVTPDVKNDPVRLDSHPSNNLATSEPVPDSKLEDFESQPDNDHSSSETADQGLQTSKSQAASEKAPANQSVNSESETNNKPGDFEAQLNNQFVHSEAPPTSQLVNPDAHLVSSEAPPEKKLAPEDPPSGQLVNSEAPPNSDQDNSETRASNEVISSDPHSSIDVIISETPPGAEVVVSETQPNNDVGMSETQPSNEAAKPQAQPGNEVAMPEAQPGNGAFISETETSDIVMSEANSITHPNNQFAHPEHLPNNQFTNFHMLDENQMPIPESLHNFDTEPLQNDHPTDTKPILDNNLAHYETLPNNHLTHSGTMPNHQLSNSEFLSHDQLADSQMLSHYEIANGEAGNNNELVVSQSQYEIVNSETPPNYEIIDASAQHNDDERTPETQPNKRRKKKSLVWEHFTIETVSPGCRRACCKQCKQSFAYSTGSKVAGTSHLKRHIAKGTCSALLRNQQQNQLSPYTPRGRGSGGGSAIDTPKRRYRSPSTPYMIFDQDRCRHEIAKMIIMHDYPLHMVEHPGFVAFVQNLQPQFNMVTFNTIQGDCVAAYLREKQNLMKHFEGLSGRFCLTLDMWTSSQSVGYVFITGHFVDIDWKLQRRILNVVMEPYPDSDSALSDAVSACVSDWRLEGRLFSITTNQALNGGAPENLRPLLSVKNPLILNGQLVLGNCIARNLSSVATDLLGSAQEIVKKIRSSVKYVKTSESREEKFLELKQQLQVPSERNLFIDDQTQWNTTYQMLVAASELKEVFSCLDTSDPDYKGAPTMQDWKLVETLCTYLKPIYDVANILAATTNLPSAITIFQEVWKLQLDYARAVMSEDPFISNLTKIMQEKIDKYWRECSLVLATAVVMDPRLKMKFVEYSFSRVYGEDAHAYIKIVDDGIHELFREYEALPLPLTPAYADEGKGSLMKTEEYPGGTLLSDGGLTDFDAYIMETSSQQMKSELDVYLEESLLPRVQDIDVWGWWRLNRVKYPTLSKMARDILCVAASTVPPDSVFDTKSKEMDQYRSSLRPETVEALVCAKDWMQYGM